jgi:thiol-disulfide isomerase/thioredoxin
MRRLQLKQGAQVQRKSNPDPRSPQERRPLSERHPVLVLIYGKLRAAVFLFVFVVLPHCAFGQGVKKSPSLTLKSIEGRTVRLSDYRGKVVLINFWATWCPPCRAEMPALVKLQREYGKENLQIIGVTYPPEWRARVRRLTRRLKVNYPVVLGTRETKAVFSPDETLPLTVIIDRGGTIRGVIAGILLPAEFDLHIKPLLQRRATERETNHVQKNK